MLRRHIWGRVGHPHTGSIDVRPAPETRLGMDAESSKALGAFGFLTVLESPRHGLFGGYLVLSPQGRPLEFRCSTPVVVSRAQEILYGPTLRPYLFADVIGQSLVAGSELPVQVILTDELDMLPIALIRQEEVLLVQRLLEDGAGSQCVFDQSGDGGSIIINGCRVTAAPSSSVAIATIAGTLEPLAAHVFLAEPFERIRAALSEAQLAAQEAAGEHDGRVAA
jgi:hypothetical protein